MTNRSETRLTARTWAAWLGWTWWGLLVLGTAAVAFGWETIRMALELGIE